LEDLDLLLSRNCAPQPVVTYLPGWRETSVQRMTLSNGVKVNFKRTCYGSTRFALSLVFHGGKALGVSPSEFAGTGSDRECEWRRLCPLAAQAWVRGGLKRSRPLQVEKYCRHWDLSVEAYCSPEQLVLQMEGPRDSFNSSLKLAHALVAAPGFEADTVAALRSEWTEIMSARAKNLDRRVQEKLVEMLLQDETERLSDSYCKNDIDLAEPNTLSACIASLTGAVHPEVCLSGSLEPAEVEDLVKKYMGTLPTGPQNLSTAHLKERFILNWTGRRTAFTLFVPSSTVQSRIGIAFPTVGRWGTFQDSISEYEWEARLEGRGLNGVLFISRCLDIAARILRIRLTRVLSRQVKTKSC